MATYLLTAAEMQTLDRHTIRTLGVPGLILMEQAGSLTVRAMMPLFADQTPEGRSVVVLCGKGNNGGDGFVIARHLLGAGAQVTVFLAGDPARIKGDARANLLAFQGLGGTIHPEGDLAARRLTTALKQADIVVDALFGTGLTKPVEGHTARWIGAVARSGLPVVAVDIPSGIHADTGAVLGCAVEATLTVTYGFAKRGHFCDQGASGRLVIADIGIPHRLAEEGGVNVQLVEPSQVRTLLPERVGHGHKGRFGHVLIAGGSRGLTGAPALAAGGAQAVGAGLVTVAVPASLEPVLAKKLTEAMTIGLPEESALATLCDAAAARSVTVLGPGLGRSDDSALLVRDFTATCATPLVLDADGLNSWAGRLDDFPRRLMPTVLTPHPGEMARLLGRSITEVQADRMEATRELARRLEVVVVLKGQHTVISDPYGTLWINPSGGPALASGGTGDVLAGMIGGLLAQGLAAAEAAITGVFLHGLAADIWSQNQGDAGLSAGVLARRIPAAMARLARSEPLPDRSPTRLTVW